MFDLLEEGLQLFRTSSIIYCYTIGYVTIQIGLHVLDVSLLTLCAVVAAVVVLLVSSCVFLLIMLCCSSSSYFSSQS